MKTNHWISAPLLSLLLCTFQASPKAQVEPNLVRFENSCAPAVQNEFARAVTMLHSFEYPESKRLFEEVTRLDPGCAMGQWGLAMSLWHPLWAPPSREDLEAGARALERAGKLPSSPRERDYLKAVAAFFSSTDPRTHQQRAKGYEELMEGVYSSYLEDPEAAVFYALALLATADPHDKSYAHQFKAAGLLNWVGLTQPRHPGVLHYLIHSYDFPGLAHLALEAAKTYADAAPDSAHAQHMPSHIFTRLGLWERSLASNHDSTRSAVEYTRRAKLPGHYDEGLHSMDYLMYAMLQTARDSEAAHLLEELRGIRKTDPENFKVAYTYASSPARYALERRQWQEASRLQLEPGDFPWEEFEWARAIHTFARGLGAARSGQLELALQAVRQLEETDRNLPETTLPYWREEVRVQIEVVTAWILLAQDKLEEALQLAARAADREDAVDKHPVTPGEVLPARELYADLLLETGNAGGALRQYQLVLRRAPNRLNALIGAARAARQTGNRELAEQYDALIRSQTSSGNRDRAGLAESWKPAP